MTRKILTIVVFMLLYSNLSFAQHNETTVNKTIQKKWILETIKDLKKKDSLQFLELTEPKIISNPDNNRISYRIIKKGRIQCSGGDWIYITMHSMHENKEIGDVCIGISNNGETFVNYSHVCGGIVHFIDKSVTIPEDANDFFNRFISDANEQKWVKWE